MSLSARDKKILMAIVPLVVVFGYWFMLLAPKREAATEAATRLEAVQAQLMEAEARSTTVQAAKSNFAHDYAAVVALGKAIPTSVDMPSLLVQLQQAATGTGIELEGVTMGERGLASAGAAQPAPTAPSGEPPQSAPGAAAATAQGAATTASTPPPTADPTGTATPTAPAAGGSLESVGLEFDFQGNFFELADFFHSLKRFVYVDGDKVRVRGRLMTIDSVEYTTEPETFPALTATVNATVFLTPKTEGTTAGATPAGPGAAAAPVPVSTASSDSAAPSPTPTATATP